MSWQIPVALLLMALSGVALAVQAPVNAGLGRALHSAIGAAAVSFGVGFVLLSAIAVLLGDGGNMLRAGQVPVWLLTGGMLGALFVFCSLWSVPVLGVLTTTSMLILGQMVAALLLDHVGAFGVATHELSPVRILAAALVAGGVILSRF